MLLRPVPEQIEKVAVGKLKQRTHPASSWPHGVSSTCSPIGTPGCLWEWWRCLSGIQTELPRRTRRSWRRSPEQTSQGWTVGSAERKHYWCLLRKTGSGWTHNVVFIDWFPEYIDAVLSGSKLYPALLMSHTGLSENTKAQWAVSRSFPLKQRQACVVWHHGNCSQG